MRASIKLTAALLISVALAWTWIPSAEAAAGDASLITNTAPASTAISLAMQLRNPLADIITMPLENDFEFTASPRRALTYTLNAQPVILFEVSQDWLLVTRTIIPFIHQKSVGVGERDKTGLGDINQSF